MNNKQTYLKILVNFMIMLMIFVLIIVFLPKLLSFFFPFVVAFILSLLANPIVQFMEQRIRIKRNHGSAIIIIIVIMGILTFIYLIGSILVKEATHLISDLPNIWNSMNELVDRLRGFLTQLFDGKTGNVPKMLDEITTNANDRISQILDGVNGVTLEQAGSYVRNIGNAFFMGIVTILATYFFITYRDKLAELANELLPKSVVSSMELVTSSFRLAIFGYMKAQLKIMVILIMLMFFVFVLIDIKYAFFLATLIGFIDLLPVFGTGLIFWPWAIIDFINGNYVRAIVILGLYLVCQILKQVLQPKLVGDSIEINPFSAIIFMFIGYRFQGIVGMILGIPFGMILVNFYRIGMFDRLIRGVQIIVHDLNQYRKY